MACCIKNPFDLCKISACVALFDTLQVADMDGTWTLRVYFLGAQYDMANDFEEGDPLIFPVTKPLNENHEYLAEIIDPDGEVFLIGEDDEFDGLKFQTVISL